MVDPRALVRAQLWWSAKVLPLIGIASLSALAAGTSASDGLPRLAALLVSAAGLGAYAHVVNDWADIEADEAAGKANLAAAAGPGVRGGLVAAALVVGLAPWLVVDLRVELLALLAALVALPLVYSARPIRLKGRAAAGAIADAANAHVVPIAFAMLLLADPGDQDGRWRFAFAGALVWSFGLGIRSILVHQLADEASDRAARVRTFVVRHGPVRTVVVGRRAFGIELVGLAGLAAATALLAPGAAAFFAAYLGLWVIALKWDTRPYNPVPRQKDAWMPLTEWYEVWPALAFAAALVVGSADWWPLPVAVCVLFASAVLKQGRDLLELVRIGLVELWALLRVVVVRSWFLLLTLLGALRNLANRVGWQVRKVPWHLRVLWYDGPVGRARYAAKRGITRVWLFFRHQARRFRRIVLRRPPPLA